MIKIVFLIFLPSEEKKVNNTHRNMCLH